MKTSPVLVALMALLLIISACLLTFFAVPASEISVMVDAGICLATAIWAVVEIIRKYWKKE